MEVKKKQKKKKLVSWQLSLELMNIHFNLFYKCTLLYFQLGKGKKKLFIYQVSPLLQPHAHSFSIWWNPKLDMSSVPSYICKNWTVTVWERGFSCQFPKFVNRFYWISLLICVFLLHNCRWQYECIIEGQGCVWWSMLYLNMKWLMTKVTDWCLSHFEMYLFLYFTFVMIYWCLWLVPSLCNSCSGVTLVLLFWETFSTKSDFSIQKCIYHAMFFSLLY